MGEAAIIRAERADGKIGLARRDGRQIVAARPSVAGKEVKACVLPADRQSFERPSRGRVKHLTDFDGELIKGEWLWNQLNPRIQDAVMDDRVAGVPGRVKHLQFGPATKGFIG
jgi:hypothetical protein